MANTDVAFQVGMAVGVQSAFGTINATVRDLDGTTALDSADGIVLGDKDSGDAESGITIPNLAQVVREVAPVVSSFTQSADAFLRTAVDGFDISVAMQGNGATATPSVGEAQPVAGLDALWQISGLTGANGDSNAEYDYTPTVGTGTIYATAKLWVGDQSYVFRDVVCDTTAMAFTPGGSAIATFALSVGALDTAETDIGTLGAWDYGFQVSLANPSVEGVDFTWGAAYPGSPASGFEDLTITATQEIVDLQDSNVADTGIKKAQTSRIFTVDGRIFVIDDDSDGAYTNLIDTSAPTADLLFQVGTAQTGAAQINAFEMRCNNVQNKDIKYDRSGTSTMVELSGAKCTGLTTGTEFRLTFN